MAYLDKARPVVVLTRELVRDSMTSVTVAPITTRVRGLYSEVPVGAENNLSAAGVISCDNIQTISPSDLGEHIGWLLPSQEKALAEAISHAFDLDLLWLLTSGLVKRYLPLVFMPRRQLLKTLVQLMDAGEKSLGSWLRSSRLARVLGRITPASGRLLRLEKLRKVTATAIPFSGENVMAGSLRGVMPSLQIAVYFYHKGNRGHIQGLLRKLGSGHVLNQLVLQRQDPQKLLPFTRFFMLPIDTLLVLWVDKAK